MTCGGQVEALREHIESAAPGAPVHLIAHSIGEAYAFALADRSPEVVASITSVEGNFTLEDAFWSASIAAMDEASARSAIEIRLGDPRRLLEDDGIAVTQERIARAERALAHQSWRAVWQSARGIVEATGSPEYERLQRRVFDRVPVDLIAGERSVTGWDVPAWARGRARSFTVMPHVGHLMMLESPIEFGRILATVR